MNQTSVVTVNESESKVNWDGEEIPPGPWIDRELFSIGDFVVTNKTVVGVSGATVIIILIFVAICMYISYRNRKRIAEEAQRLSTSVRSLSMRIRASFVGRPLEVNKEPGLQKSVSEIASGTQQKEFLRDMFEDQKPYTELMQNSTVKKEIEIGFDDIEKLQMSPKGDRDRA